MGTPLAPIEVWDWTDCSIKGLTLSPSPLKCTCMTGLGKGPSVFVISCVVQWDLLPYEPWDLQLLHYILLQLVHGLMESQLWTLKPTVRSLACCWGGIVRLLLTWRCSVTWGAIRAICHWHRMKWKGYACILFILQLSARHTLLSCKGKKITRTHACLSLELSRISLSWIVKLMCSCRNCCQLPPRCCLMAK